MKLPVQLHPDLQALVDSLLPFAKSMVVEHGSFNPFGAVMYPDGAIQWVAFSTGEEFPASQALIDGMTGMLQGMAAAGEIRAATICYDALAIPPGETAKVRCLRLHPGESSGDSIAAYIPYKRRDKGDVECGELFTVGRLPQFFSASARSTAL